MKWLAYAIATVVAAWVVAGLLMHLGMQRHAMLDFDPDIPDARAGRAHGGRDRRGDGA